MTLNNNIQEHFTRDSIVDMLTRYELYYQISLGNFVLETLQDFDETLEKLKELNLELPVDTALENIVEVILHHISQNDFEDKFEYHLRSRAILHALKDFVTNDRELINAENYVEQKSKEIREDKFFTDTMKLQLDSDYNFIYDSYDQIITEEIALKIRNQIK